MLLWPIVVAAGAGVLAHARRPVSDAPVASHTELQHKLAECAGELRSTRQSRDEMLTLLMGAVRVKTGADPAESGAQDGRRPRVLGVWPELSSEFESLNYEGEFESVFATGFDYVRLRGPVTRRTLINLLGDDANGKFDILHVGTHGTEEGLYLSPDDLAPTGWWARLAGIHEIKLYVLMACRSLDVADRIYAASKKPVVAMRYDIADEDAVAFTRYFYEWLSQGATVKGAADLAVMTMPSRANDGISVKGDGKL